MLLVIGGAFSYLKPQIGIPALVVLFIIGIMLIVRAYRERPKKESDTVRIAIHNCSLGDPLLGEAGYVTVIVEFELFSNNIPLQVAKQQLCLLNDCVDSIELEPTRILDKVGHHKLSYKVKGELLLRTQRGTPATYWGKLSILAGGKNYPSDEFQIPSHEL